MVFDVFREQLPHFSIGLIKTPEDVDIPNLMKFTVSLHDIGKPRAILAGDKAMQHKYTIPIMAEMMEKLGFSKAETDIALAVVDNDVLGDLLKGASAQIKLIKNYLPSPLELP